VVIYRLRPDAERDINEIWDYGAERWGEDQADRDVRVLISAIEMVADSPQRGRRRDDVRAGYFSVARESHSIFYHPAPEGGGIYVVRILHQRMDIKRHL
jgi:toxin ParE1/3/4